MSVVKLYVNVDVLSVLMISVCARAALYSQMTALCPRVVSLLLAVSRAGGLPLDLSARSILIIFSVPNP